MRKLPEKEARELIVTIGQARSYIQQNLWHQVEASLYRLYHVENKLREVLGEQPLVYACYHQCQLHPFTTDAVGFLKPEHFHPVKEQSTDSEEPERKP